MYKWFLAFRYLHTKLIAFFGVASVTLCVAMVLVVISVMGGFLDTIRSQARRLHSEIVVDAGSIPGFPLYEEFRDYLKEHLPEVVKASTPVIINYGIFRVPENTYTKLAQVMGIRMSEYIQLNDFAKGLEYDRFFPGTTHLGPQQMPVVGLMEGNRFQWPAYLEEANQAWRRTVTDANTVKEFDRLPYEKALYPETVANINGERVFAVAPGPPTLADREYPGLIAGCDVMSWRRPDGKFDRFLARGGMVTLTLQAVSPSGNQTGEPPITAPFRYVDDSRSGIFEIDSKSVYVDFEVLQKKLAMDAQPLADGGFTKPRTNQVLIALKPGVDLQTARDRISLAWSTFLETQADQLTLGDIQQTHYVRVHTWEDLQSDFIAAVEKEKVLVTFLFALISLVAIAMVGCIFYMIVEKKTKDIGILKSLGASASGVAWLFIFYAAAVGVTGAILGTIIGSAFVWNINDIQDGLAWLNPALRIWSPQVYSFDRIPEEVKRLDVIVIGIAAVLSSMIGSLIPATIAGRVWPVRALRYE